MDCNSRPSSTGSRPPSIIRSHRDSFVATFESLPPESVIPQEFGEEVQDHEVVYDESLNYGEDINECSEPLSNLKKHNEEKLKRSKSTEAITSDSRASNRRSSDGRASGKGSSPSSRGSSSNANDDEQQAIENEIDKKIRKGLNKIQKLDTILAKKVKREKQVKKERRAFEKEFHLQVQNLINEKGKENILGSQQLLTLCNSSDGSKEDENHESIFTTQIDAEFYNETLSDTKLSEKGGRNSKNKSPTKKNKSKFDFVNRNKELAGHAQDNVLLTEEERKRLDELLADDSNLLLVENPFSTQPLTNQNAYSYSDAEIRSIDDIDAKLRDLIPEDDYELVSIITQTPVDRSRLPTSPRDENIINHAISNSELGLAETDIECGERILQEKKDERELSQRLKNIDYDLKRLQELENDDCYPLDPDLLRRLIDSDSRLTSSSVSICDSVTSRSDLHQIDECHDFQEATADGE